MRHATEAEVIDVINKPDRGDYYLGRGVAILTLADWQSIRHSACTSAVGESSERVERRASKEDRVGLQQGTSPGGKAQRLSLMCEEEESRRGRSTLYHRDAQEAEKAQGHSVRPRVLQAIEQGESAPELDSTALVQEFGNMQGKVSGRERPREEEEDDKGNFGKLKR